MKKKYTNPFFPSAEKIELSRQLNNYLIWLYLIDEGQDVGDGFVMLRVLCNAFRDPLITAAIRMIDHVKERGTWRKTDLLSIVAAINQIKRMPMLSTQDAQRVLRNQGVAA
jgi:hypothetical protein